MSFKFYAIPPTADKSTRDCLDPWFMIYVSADRTVKPCCPHSAIGVLSDDVTLSEILDGPGIRELRRSLLNGELDAECANCPTRPLIDPESLRRKLRAHIAYAMHEAGVVPGHQPSVQQFGTDGEPRDAAHSREFDEGHNIV